MRKFGFVLALIGALSLPHVSRAADKVSISHSAVSGSQAILFVARDAGLFKK